MMRPAPGDELFKALQLQLCLTVCCADGIVYAGFNDGTTSFIAALCSCSTSAIIVDNWIIFCA